MTDYQTFNDIFVRAKPIKLVGGVNPYRRSDRMAAQQGIFLCPGDVTETFEENLSQILRPRSNGNLIKLTIRPSLAAKREMFARLSRMNISRATLFPGLDGFATSLGSLEQPEVMTPDDNWLRYKVGRK